MARPATLLLLVPLRLEQAALGPAPRATVGPTTILIEHLGMGPAKAAATSQRLASSKLASSQLASSKLGALRPPGAGAGAIAVAGLGGALSSDLGPGDLVVADRLIDSTGKEVARLPSGPLLAGELRRLGLRARTATVVSTDHIVTGDERSQLAALGADVVDMESTAVALAPWGRPLAVVRAVSDTPGHELFSAAGARGVWAALASLRAARPALARWAAAAGPRDVVLAGPRSFCAGVNRAIATVERALELYGPPVYVRRQIVHNAHVVSRLEGAGAVFVQELDEVPDGSRVVFSAHGVGTEVARQAAARGMATIDATCPLVSKVHNEARRFAAAGRQVVLIGHPGHDEVEGTLGTIPGARLVTIAADVATLDLDAGQPTSFVTQTTLAQDDVTDVVAALESRFADLARPAASDICYASHNRQEAVRRIAPDCDLVLVVGSPNSSNSNRLVEVARRHGAQAHLVDSEADLRLAWLDGARTVGVTAGASAPEQVVQQLVACLAGLGPVALSERSSSDEHVSFPLPMEVR